MKVFSHTSKTRIQLYFGIICILIFVTAFAVSNRGQIFTEQFFDPIRTTQERNEVVLVGIDDASLQKIGAWPWKRSVFADITKILEKSGAKVVVYEVLFWEKREGDDQLSDVLTQSSMPVILAGKLVEGKYLQSFFVTQERKNTYSSIANIQPDSDGKVRMYPSSFLEKGECTLPLAEKAFQIVTHREKGLCNSKDSFSFRYSPHIVTYSLVDILDGKIAPELLRGKIVFIGSTSLDLEDHFVGLSGEKVPGVYVHASIFTSLLNNENDKTLSFIYVIAILLASIAFTLFALYVGKKVITQVGFFLGVVASLFIASYIFFIQQIIIPLPWMILSAFTTGGYVTLIRFIHEKKESRHIQNLFSKYVHKDVLRELMKSPEKLNLQGEKRELTVLFSDLRGFTTLSESLSPEELTKILNGYFSAMTPSILEEHGTIDKFIGDAIMAFWNAPLEVQHHERHAVLSALRMQEALRDFNKQHDTTLAVGVGIHTGHAVVGNVGSQERVNYTVLGDTVNLASRVESLTKKYGVEILVTEEVKNKVDDTGIIFRKLDVITVKGKTEPTVLYEVMRSHDINAKFVKEYGVAFLEYQSGNFAKASELFKALADKGDLPSEKMYERLSSLSNIENWDGVWHFDEK